MFVNNSRREFDLTSSISGGLQTAINTLVMFDCDRRNLVTASIISFISRFRSFAIGLAAGYFVLVACGGPEKAIPIEPLEAQTYAPVKSEQLNLLPGTPGEAPIFPASHHLSPCEGSGDCVGGTNCVSLGTGACFYTCDPKKASGGDQNPDCIAPENCIELSGGSGSCIALPGQLYGSGSYKAIIRLEAGARCLLRYGGCTDGYLCVDTQRHGSIGRCTEECNISTPNAPVQPTCQTPNTTCQRLISGFGACLPK